MHTPFLSNRLGRWLAVTLLALLSATSARAQLAGTKAIPGDYATVAAAISALNAGSVGAGGVTFNIAAGYTETFASPTAGAITATGTAANPIVFQKTGTGPNPKITAGVGTSTTVDAIISLAGSDYVTFDGLDVAESAANTTPTTQAEFGYALFRASATDGCQNNTIRNCVVTLNKTNTGTIGIYGAPSAAASSTAVTATATTGANSNNKVYGNVVTNTLTGIYFAAGSSTTIANYDQNNEIGSIVSGTTATGNTVGNFGGSASGYGAGGTYQNSLKIQGNTLNNTLDYTSATASTSVAASTVTSTLRGVYTPSGTSSNLDIVGNAITLASGATTSAFYGIDNSMGGTPASNTVNINNNTFALTYTLAVTTGTLYAISNSAGPATLNISGNTVSSITQAGTGAVYVISNSNSATTANVTNNTATNITRTGASGSFYGYANSSGGGTENLTNNSWSNITLSTSSTVYGAYNNSSALESQQWSGNTVSGITNTGSGTLYGLYCSYGSAASQFYNNTVTGLSGAGTTGGIYLPNTSLTQVAVYGNTVGNISTSAASSSVYGIYTTVPTAGIYRNKVYGITGTGTGGVAYGIYTASGTTVSIYNNLVGNITAPASTSLLAVTGIGVISGTTVNVYYNTIYLNASSSGATFGTSGVYLGSTSTTLDQRNNIIVNTSTAAGTGGYTVAFRRVSGTAGTVPANYATTSNNNLFYAGTPSATNLIYVEGSTTATNAQQTLAAYKAFMVNRDQASVTENPPFASTTGSATNFLHIATGTATQVESGGAPVSGITTDYDGDARNAGTPDIGADEGSFTPNDQNPPTITYTALGNTGSTGNRTLTVTITDPSGVATGTGAPRLYYRVGTSGAYTSVAATSVSGSSYTFTIPGAATGSTVQYYVAAQDASANGNVGTSPAGGSGANPPGSTSPATPNAYQILTTLSGTYYVTATVGSSPNPAKEFATLTAAVAAYNGNGLSGAVTFVLLDASYSTGETFPLVLNSNGDASATNTLTIKPGTGVTASVTGSVAAGAVLKLNGADYVIIDGSNNGTTSQNLTITNTSATGSGNAVLWVAAASATDGATNNVVKNTNLTGNASTGFPQFTVFVGGGGVGVASPTTSTPASNSNNTFANNVITKGYYGVFVFGVSAAVLDQGNTFTGNQIGQVASGTGFGQEGLRLVYQQGANVTGNDIQNITNGTTTANLYGIFLADSKGSVVSRNAVHGISYTGTSTTKVWAINTSTANFITAANASANRLDNNLVYGINSTAISSTWNTVGINLGGGYGDQIVYNTVYLSGQLSAASGTAGSAAFANGNPSVTSVATNIDVRNNIFSIIGGTGGTSSTPLYAHYEQGTTVTGSTLDYNDLYVTAGATGTAIIGRLNATDYATLAAWRTATGQEANSVSVDPQFVQTTTVPYNLTPTASALNGTATPIASVTVDYTGATRSTTPDIGAYEFTPPACQAVSNLAFASITPTTASVTFTAPTGGAGANSYTVTYTPAGGTATTVTPNPTGSPVALTGLTPSTTYTVTVTTNCTGAASPGATGTFRTACPPPTYATLPATEGFENTWLSRCDTREVPSASWANTPTTGNNSWRRDDDGASANWTSPNAGAFTPAGSQGSVHAARFHSYYTAAGVTGALDFYVDLSATGTKRLTFDYVNGSTAGSKLDVLLSTDGGATFSATPLLSVATSAAFSTRTVDLTATSATSVIRFRGTGDFGSYDIGLDNVQVRLLPNVDLAATALVAPTATQGCYSSAETVTVAVTNVGAQALDFSVNPATVTATVTTPSGPQTLNGSITTGTLAAGAAQNVTLTSTLNMATAGTYTFALAATVTGDGNTANDALTPAPTRTVVAPVAGTLSPANGSLCVSGTAALSLTGAANGSIQYQSSPDNVTFTDISGATSATYTTPVLTSTTYYRAQVRCGANVATSNVSTITVSNPQVASTNGPVAICAGSTATLTATASTGNQVRFFDVATGGTALVTTTPGSYTTPALTASTTYYTEAYTSSSSVAGLADNSANNGTFVQSSLTDYPLGFAVSQAGTLASVDVYPSAAGTLTIRLYSTTGTQPGGTTTAVAGSDVTITVTAAQVGTRVTVPLNYALNAGEYRISNSSGTLGRFSTYTGTYPLTSGPLTVRGSYNSATSTTFSNTTYNSFFNLTFNSECAGASRTAIPVNVTQPATASFAAATGSSCGTSAVTLTGTVGGSATGGTYTSSGTGTFSPNASTLGATYTPSAADVTAGSVTITLTSAGSTPCPAATATFALSITPAPVATFSYPASTTYCAGSTSTVSPTLGSGATAGTFSSTAGLTINAATGVITLSSSTSGTYTVTNTVAASGACAAVSATTTVTIAPATTATFSYSGGTFCITGTNPTATVTGTAGGTFSSAAGLSLNASTGAINLSASMPGTYTVTYTVAGACGSSSTQSVTITTAPLAAFSYGTTSTYCVSGATNPAPSYGTGASGGVFSSAAGLTLNATTGVITLASSTPGTYTVTNTIAASGGCAAATATAQVTVTAAPLASFSYGTTSTFCVSGTANPAVTLGTGATAGTFTSAAGLSLNATTGAITLSTSTPGTYTVTNTVAAANGCAAATATAQVTITAAPLATFSYATSSACAGSASLLPATLGTGATAGTFSSAAGLTINATTGAVNPATSAAGTYTVTNTVAAANGCAAATSTATVTINALPATPTYTYTYPTRSTVLFSSSAAPAGTTYQWYVGTTPIAGATSQTYTANGTTNPGSYTVRFISTVTGCQSAPSTALVVTATTQPLAGSSLTLFPNPTATGKLTLELSGYSKAVQLTVLDAVGRVVLTQRVAAGQVQTQLDLSGAATGVYLLRATTDGGTDVRRIVRE